MTPKQIAEQAGRTMWAEDHVSQGLGMRLLEIDVGYAKLAMEVEARHCNGHQILHGGIMFTFADSGSAFASNSRNQVAVSQHNIITYLASAQIGEGLIAEAREVALTGRNGIYDVRVVNQDNKPLAEFRGFTRLMDAVLFEQN